MQLIGALRRVSIFSSQASSLIKLRMQENQIVVSAQDIDFSTSAEETQVCQYAGAAMSIGFKSTFLIDILNNISAEEVIIELADPFKSRCHYSGKPMTPALDGSANSIITSSAEILFRISIRKVDLKPILIAAPAYWHTCVSSAEVEKSIS